MRKVLMSAPLAALALVLTATSAHASTVTLTAVAQGSVSYDGIATYTAVPTDYRVGFDASALSRNYFIFNVPANLISLIGGPISSAVLRLNTYGVLSDPSPGTVSYAVYDVNGSTVSDLQGSVTTPQLDFDDLGNGPVFLPGGPTSYAATTINDMNDNQPLSMSLNGSGLLAIGAAIGGDLGIGGALGTNDGFNGNFDPIYSFLGSGAPVQLDITAVVTAVPEPSSIALWSIGAVGFVVLRRRRKIAA